MKRLQSIGGKEEDDFTQPFTPFSPFRPIATAVKNSEFPLDVKESMFLLLGLPVHCTLYLEPRKISREVIQRSVLKWDSNEWHRTYEDMGQCFQDFSNGLAVHL